jgi:hypothetical protein
MQLSQQLQKETDVAHNTIQELLNAGILVASSEGKNEQYIFEDYLKVLDDEY